jgi:tetratricopeptide (TPR) repeat protein
LSLVIKSHAYAGVFVNQETLWTYNAEHNSRSSSVYSNLGFVLNRSGHPGPAAVSYEKAVELDPDDAEAQDEFADLLAGQNKIAEARPHYEKAIAVYTAALQRDSSLRGFNNRLGLDLTKVGRAAEAVVQFEQALARNPVSYEVHTNLGLALFHLGRIPEAISHYAAAARLNPGSATIQSNLGYALVVAGRPAEALVHFEQALQIDPDYPGAHNNAGYALAQLGRYAEARSQFEAALRLTPDDAEARSNLARLPPPPP